MRHKLLLLLTATVTAIAGMLTQRVPAQAEHDRVIRLAELEIDPAQVEAYKAALEQEIDASIQLEPGVLTLYAVFIKGHPERIRLFEMYRDDTAYRSHLQTPHFLRYKAATAGMVKSLTLLEAEPIRLGTKSALP